MCVNINKANIYELLYKTWTFAQKPSQAKIGNSSKNTITITFDIFNVLLQLLSYFLYKKRPITITLAITGDNSNIFLFDIVCNFF